MPHGICGGQALSMSTPALPAKVPVPQKGSNSVATRLAPTVPSILKPQQPNVKPMPGLINLIHATCMLSSYDGPRRLQMAFIGGSLQVEAQHGPKKFRIL